MYADSKLMLYMFTVEMQKRFKAAGSSVETFAAHPGVAQTDAFRKSDKSKPAANLLASGAKFLGQSPGGGAQSILKALTDPALTGESQNAQLQPRHLCAHVQLFRHAQGSQPGPRHWVKSCGKCEPICLGLL